MLLKEIKKGSILKYIPSKYLAGIVEYMDQKKITIRYIDGSTLNHHKINYELIDSSLMKEWMVVKNV